MNLEQQYAERIQKLGYQADDAQIGAVRSLDRLLRAVSTRQQHKQPWWMVWRKDKAPAPRGVYLWGDVGRGKTFLMDLFHEALPPGISQRVHFHRFMLDVHAALRGYPREQGPLSLVANDISRDKKVLCLDELFVADIGDAMILSGLFGALLEQGVSLVITSNTRPDDLYRDGLQRDRFLPAIDLINEHLEVVCMSGEVDHRLQRLDRDPVYYATGLDADKAMESLFQSLAPAKNQDDVSLTINNRELKAKKVAEGIMWFDFRDLCDGPRAKADYVEIARLSHTLFISDIPVMSAADDNMARRFVELVDVLYDRNVNVVVSAAAPPEGLYTGKRLAHGFRRTTSRLVEFQSRTYMAQPHRP